jgi:beta-mannosidase
MAELTDWEVSGDPAGDVDAQDFTFRTTFARPAGGETVLRLDGVATVWEAELNGEVVASDRSMFAAHRVDVAALLRDDNELVIRCFALAPLLAERRKPRARWRTQVAADGNLRWFRTTLLGRAPGFAPGPPVVGPWRPVRLERPRPDVRLRARLDGDEGVISAPGALLRCGDREAEDELRLPGAARWWPHTHGEPALHEVEVLVGGDVVDRRRVGFRAIGRGDPDGLDLRVNGVPVFCRGAVWTPAPGGDVRAALERVRDAGMNMVRLPGTGVYETEEFHATCDELGILVWQDFMFANMDYPIADPEFRATVEAEAHQAAGRLAAHPSTVVLCGNSEVEQQVAMLGLDPELGRGELFGELLPAIAAEEGSDAIYVPSSPTGGTLPFRPNAGIANYFGVGGYRRPLADARRAAVRFAGECLAIANVGADDEALLPAPRDRGADWDFADVRDHYLSELFGIDPQDLRARDPERYVALSRAVSGEVMAEVFGEWRRPGSPCTGGIVVWLHDLVAGPGWGLVDRLGRPKEALHRLRAALAPVAVWTTDEGQNGIAVHVANDRPEPLEARLRVSLYRDGEVPVGEGETPVTLGPHGAVTFDAEGVLGRFSDVSYAYRFGEPQQDVVVASLERDGALLGQAFRFPVGHPLDPAGAEELGLEMRIEDGELALSARRVVYDLRVHTADGEPVDEAFSLEPGRPRRVPLGSVSGVRVTALNLDGEVEA